MKKTCILLFLCVLLLTPLLCACGTPAPSPTPEPPADTPEPPADTPEPAPLPDPIQETDADGLVQADGISLPAPEETDNGGGGVDYAPYRDLVDTVTRGLRDGWTDVSVEELGISDMFKRDSVQGLGWLQRDVNHDGVDELLFGQNLDSDDANPTYDIFSLLSGKAFHTATGLEYNRWYLLEDGLLVNEWNNTGYDRYYSAYGLFNGTLLPANRAVDRSEYIRLSFEPFLP